MCEACKQKQQDVQRESTAPAAAPPAVQQALSRPGRPLDSATRGFMEARFGRDFSAVRPPPRPRSSTPRPTRTAPTPSSALPIPAAHRLLWRDILQGASKLSVGEAQL
jgi:hypothetical protein